MLFSVLGLEFPKGLNNFDFGTIIRKSGHIVKDNSLAQSAINEKEDIELEKKPVNNMEMYYVLNDPSKRCIV